MRELQWGHNTERCGNKCLLSIVPIGTFLAVPYADLNVFEPLVCFFGFSCIVSTRVSALAIESV